MTWDEEYARDQRRDGWPLAGEDIESACMVKPNEIKRRREEMGYGIREAARAAGWGDTGGARWQRLENGTPADPAISTLEAVADVLDCKVDDLLAKHKRRD
jgi:transcriptional regulator with XRE-family HTH domain